MYASWDNKSLCEDASYYTKQTIAYNAPISPKLPHYKPHGSAPTFLNPLYTQYFEKIFRKLTCFLGFALIFFLSFHKNIFVTVCLMWKQKEIHKKN